MNQVNIIPATPIQGKLVVVKKKLTDYEKFAFTDEKHYQDTLKRDLAMQLAKILIEEKLVEFTHNTSVADLTTTVAARCYIAPDDKIRVVVQAYEQ
jgi:hypothetical protein